MHRYIISYILLILIASFSMGAGQTVDADTADGKQGRKAPHGIVLTGKLKSLIKNMASRSAVDKDSTADVTFRKIDNNAFQVGEHLIFDIVYGPITAGTATMTVQDTQWINGRACYHIVTTAESNSFFDNFFKVRDRVESFIDVGGIFTWKFEKHVQEGSYHVNRYAEYDQVNGRVYTSKDTILIPRYTQDILSSFYYVRTVPLEIGKSFPVDNFSDGRVYPLKVKVHAKDRVKVPAGTFDCIVVEPILEGEGLFNQKGRLAIWLTDDEKKIPVLMKSKVLVGSIDAELREIKTITQ